MKKTQQYEVSPSLVANFIDDSVATEGHDKSPSTRQQILAEYSRLEALMKEKNWSRHDLYNYFKEMTKAEISEKTFLNYLTEGKSILKNGGVQKTASKRNAKIYLSEDKQNSQTKNKEGRQMQFASLFTDEKSGWPGLYTIGGEAAGFDTIQEVDWLKPGLPLGGIGARIAASSVGKTLFSIQECVAIAIGREFCGHKYTRGGVLYLSAEEPINLIKLRLHELHKTWAITRKENEMLQANARISSLYGRNHDLLEQSGTQYLLEEALSFSAKNMSFYENDRLRLIVLDNLRRFHNMDEDSGREMNMVMHRLEAISKRIGCSIIFTHHFMPPPLANSVRYQEQLKIADNAENDERIEWSIVNQNYGKQTEPVLLKRNDNGVLLPVS